MVNSAALKPRKKPRQQRSTATVAIILEAATRILERHGLAGFNTNRVADVAGISVGSLYQYFPNKNALMAALIERTQHELADALDTLVTQLRGASWPTTLQALAHYAVEQQYRRPRLAAALDHEERSLPVQALLRPTDARLHNTLQRLLANHRDALDPALPAHAPQDCLLIAKALVETDALAGNAPAADLEARLIRALGGYLCGAKGRK